MMRTGLRMLDCHSAEAVMVGDRMDTDVISGMESGMSTVLVLSGVSTRGDCQDLRLPPNHRAGRRGGYCEDGKGRRAGIGSRTNKAKKEKAASCAFAASFFVWFSARDF